MTVTENARSPRYLLQDFSVSTLRQWLSRHKLADTKGIRKKAQLSYLESYFRELKPSKMLLESRYIDRGFLDDYSEYYVRCFAPYNHVCSRVHFFSYFFTEEDFEAMLTNKSPKEFAEHLQNGYLGFMVVRPLPYTVIGRTCLRVYPEEGGRVFPVTRSYDANLFGLSLAVDSLPYQEQDRTVGACATAALWSIFQGTSHLFEHPALSPVEITNAAVENLPLQTRAIPNQGLQSEQIAQAIRRVGLEPEFVDAHDEFTLKSALYAYLRAGIPILMGLCEDGMTSADGEHAVVVTGYRLGRNRPTPYGHTGFLTNASRIDQIYVHDDQLGPFARMVFGSDSPPWEKSPQDSSLWLWASWVDQNEREVKQCFDPLYIMVPLYHKIRIQYETIEGAVKALDHNLELYRSEGFLEIAERFEWEIYLTKVNRLKAGLFGSSAFEVDEHLRDVLLEPLPRFLWRATGQSQGIPVIDLFFDGTDIGQGKIFVRAVKYCPSRLQNLSTIARCILKNLSDSDDDRLVAEILESLSQESL